jgi:hypothetical protein
MADKHVVVEELNPTPKQLPIEHQELPFLKDDGFTQRAVFRQAQPASEAPAPRGRPIAASRPALPGLIVGPSLGRDEHVRVSQRGDAVEEVGGVAGPGLAPQVAQPSARQRILGEVGRAGAQQLLHVMLAKHQHLGDLWRLPWFPARVRA